MKTLVLTLFITLSHAALSAIPGVDWHKGTVEEAMASAKQKNKPMFLYWGAVWCPPCNQIKKTIFTKSEFHREAKNFVSVYLDGDNPNAQKWGEHFGAVGYPTMMILNSAGEEITRMPGGLNVNQYVALMKKTRTNQLSILELFNKVKSKKANLNDYERLAGYSWSQDVSLKKSLLSKENKAKTFYTIYNNAPAKAVAAKAQFFLRYQLAKNKQDKNYQADEHDLKKFLEILENEKALKGNIGLLTYSPMVYKKLFGEKLGNKKFKMLYLGAMNKLRDDKSLDINDRMTTLYPEIRLNRKEKKTPKSIQKKVIAWSDKIDKASKDGFSRQSNITTAIWLLKTAGLLDEARALATKELKVSISPFYIMRYLVSIEIDSGNIPDALKWSKKAWRTAKGHATRFEWGTSYLLNLMKHQPKRTGEITATTEKVFNELVSQSKDAFEGRNKKRLGRLKKSFKTWKKSYKDDFYGLSANLNNNCKKAVNKDIQKRCVGWVKKL